MATTLTIGHLIIFYCVITYIIGLFMLHEFRTYKSLNDAVAVVILFIGSPLFVPITIGIRLGDTK